MQLQYASKDFDLKIERITLIMRKIYSKRVTDNRITRKIPLPEWIICLFMFSLVVTITITILLKPKGFQLSPIFSSSDILEQEPIKNITSLDIPDKIPEAMENVNLRRWVMNHRMSSNIVNITTHHVLSAYESSVNELAWLDGNRTGKICRTAQRREQQNGAIIWLNYSYFARTPRSFQQDPTELELKALSFFHSGSKREPIEPLHGIGRNPFAAVGCNGTVDIFDISYLIFSNHCNLGKKQYKAIFFDLGASIGFAGVEGGVYNTTPEHGGGLAPSLPLFYRIYDDRCLTFDEIYAWEPNIGVTHEQFWGTLSPDIRAKVRFFEIGVSEGELHEAVQGTVIPTSFLRMLEATAKPEDFVVVKLDIDTPEIEHVIMQTLALRPKLASLIDEIFIEYHFYFDGNDFGWGTRDITGDVDSALAMMYKLRTLGVRAHFWI